MPIHDQGYRSYRGGRTPPGRAWFIIARAGIHAMLTRRAFVALLLLSWVPFLVRSVQIYAATSLTQVSFLAPNARMFRQFLDQQQVFMFSIAVYAGAGLIANDRRANALQIYLSKPLTRLEYIAGKFAILASLLLFVTWVPGTLLLVVQVAFSGSFAFIADHPFLFPAITLFSFIQVAAVGAAMLALSSLTKSSRYAGVLYAALIFFSQALYGVAFALTRDSRMAWVSVVLDLAQIGDALFGVRRRFQMSLPVAFLAIAALIAAAGAILERRVRGLEVVS